MPTHWTYTDVPPDADLMQGDILIPTDGLNGIFSEVHPHFCKPKYTAFLVTTQSCDLVRRKDQKCSARYLNIAVVRQLEDVLHDLLSHVCRPVIPQVYEREGRGEAKLLLNRIFNQNEQALGLFYLHEDADAGIAVPSVALLRVGIALRAKHYDVLLDSRRGRLAAEFTAKLGWLLGNLYSRVGTPDWSEPRERKKQLEGLVRSILDPSGTDTGPVWVQSSLVTEASRNGVEVATLSRSDLLKALENYQPPTKKDLVIGRVSEVVKEVVPELTEDQVEKVCNRLRNDRGLASFMKAGRAED